MACLPFPSWIYATRIPFFWGKKGKLFMDLNFRLLFMNNSSDFSILTHVKYSFILENTNVFQAVTGIKNNYENTIFLLCAANSVPNSFSNVEENVIACQSTDVFFLLGQCTVHLEVSCLAEGNNA